MLSSGGGWGGFQQENFHKGLKKFIKQAEEEKAFPARLETGVMPRIK